MLLSLLLSFLLLVSTPVLLLQLLLPVRLPGLRRSKRVPRLQNPKDLQDPQSLESQMLGSPQNALPGGVNTMPMGTLRTGQDRSHHITRVSGMRGVRSSRTAARGIKAVHGLELCDPASLASLLAQSRRKPTSLKTYVSSQLHFGRVKGTRNLQSSIQGLVALLSLFFSLRGPFSPLVRFRCLPCGFQTEASLAAVVPAAT